MSDIFSTSEYKWKLLIFKLNFFSLFSSSSSRWRRRRPCPSESCLSTSSTHPFSLYLGHTHEKQQRYAALISYSFLSLMWCSLTFTFCCYSTFFFFSSINLNIFLFLFLYYFGHHWNLFGEGGRRHWNVSHSDLYSIEIIYITDQEGVL